MRTLEQQFASRLSAFLRRTGLRPTTFGRMALGDPNLVRQIDGGRSLSLKTADRVLAFMAEYNGDSGGALGPAPPPSTPDGRVTDEENEEKQSDDRTTDRTEYQPADPLPAAAGGAGPHGPVAEHDLCAGGARGASPGRSRWVRAPWAGSRLRWTSGSASGSRRAGVSRTVPSTAPQEGGPGGHSHHPSPDRRGAGRGGGAMIGHLRGRDRALGSFGWTERDRTHRGSALGIVHLRREQFHAGDFLLPTPIRIDLPPHR